MYGDGDGDIIDDDDFGDYDDNDHDDDDASLFASFSSCPSGN